MDDNRSFVKKNLNFFGFSLYELDLNESIYVIYICLADHWYVLWIFSWGSCVHYGSPICGVVLKSVKSCRSWHICWRKAISVIYHLAHITIIYHLVHNFSYHHFFSFLATKGNKFYFCLQGSMSGKDPWTPVLLYFSILCFWLLTTTV